MTKWSTWILSFALLAAHNFQSVAQELTQVQTASGKIEFNLKPYESDDISFLREKLDQSQIPLMDKRAFLNFNTFDRYVMSGIAGTTVIPQLNIGSLSASALVIFFNSETGNLAYMDQERAKMTNGYSAPFLVDDLSMWIARDRDFKVPTELIESIIIKGPMEIVRPAMKRQKEAKEYANKESVCGELDNRQLVESEPVGRVLKQIGGYFGSVCSAFLSASGVLYSAGHCFLKSEGKAMKGSFFLQFRVKGNSDEFSEQSSADDFYLIDKDALVARLAKPEAPGGDWAIVGVKRNVNTLKHPKEVYQGLVVTEVPSIGDEVIAIGFGDNNIRTSMAFRQQGSTGEIVELVKRGEDEHYVYYDLDTSHGMSGGAVLSTKNRNAVIAIHTDGMCPEEDSNAGTLISDPALRAVASR